MPAPRHTLTLFFVDVHTQDPARTLREAVDSAGACMTDEERTQVLKHLPNAMRTCSSLLIALAHAT